MANKIESKKRGEMWIAQILTAVLILFMLLVPYSGAVDTDGTLTRLTRDLLYYPLAAYVLIEMIETANRDIFNAWGFISDSGMAILVMLVGIGIFIIDSQNTRFDLTPDQSDILRQCLTWGFVDLLLGLLFSFRIIGSPKARDET